MSVFYEVSERFEIPAVNQEKHMEFRSMLTKHLESLYSYDEKTINKFVVKADGDEYRYPEASFEMMLSAFNYAENSMELALEYTYTWRVGTEDTIGFDGWLEYAGKADNSFLSTIFCRLYNYADCSNSTGCIAAYGMKNGKLYHADIPFLAISSAPEGRWRTNITAVVLDDDYTEKQTQKLIPLCKRLKKLSSADTFITGKKFEYYMNNPEFSSPADFIEYTDCVEQISNILDSNEFMGETEFMNTDDFRMLRIITDGSKAVGFEISEI